MTMRLQKLDGVVQSIKDIRPLFPNMNNDQFAEWYADRYRLTVERVLNILKHLEEE